MNERVVADFVGEFYLSGMDRDDPVRGRIVMSPRRLVLAGESRRETIPTTSVFDIAVGQVPPEMRAFFSDSVTVAYEVDDTRRLAIVEAGAETIEKFTDVLFKAQLNGREVTVEHPARRGGRVVDTPARPARLTVDDRRLGFGGPEVDFDVDLATVTSFERGTRTLDGRSRPALVVHHVPRTTALVSVVALSDEELQVLVGVYSTDGEAEPTDVITADASRTALVLDGLREKGLVVDGEGGIDLTPKGRIVVNSRLETVNA